MSEENPETEEKQNYLKEHILDKGYDANEFTSFLISKKGEGGDDILNWSLQDLKGAVEEFLSQKDEQKNENKIEEPKEEEKKEEPKVEEKKEEPKVEEKKEEPKVEEKKEVAPEKNASENNQSSKDSYGIYDLKEIKCQKITDINELNKCENLMVRVESFQKVEGKLFSKSYVVYIVTTSPLNFKVKRRFSDFEWLRQTIANVYGYNAIPTIPRKNKIGGDDFEEAFLRKRSRTFEKFLGYLMIHPVLKHLKVVYEFLSIENDSEFHKIKKNYEKMKQPANVKDFISVDGEANIEINAEKEQNMQKIKEIATFNEGALKKIQSSMLSLKDDLLNAQIKLKEISISFGSLKKKAIEYSEDEDVIQTYDELNSMFLNFSNTISKQNYYIFVHMREYFKYVKNNYRSLKELIHNGESLKSSFNKSYKSLTNKKEELFKKSEVAKWDLDPKENIDKSTITSNKNLALEKMLYKDTASVNNQKEKYGFYLNRIIAEHQRMKKINSVFHLRYAKNILEKFQNATSTLLRGIEQNYNILKTPKDERKKLKQQEIQNKNNEDNDNLEKISQDIVAKKSGDKGKK